MRAPVNPGVAPVKTATLVPILERGLTEAFGKLRSITKIERRPSEYRSSFLIEELTVSLDDGTSMPVMFKHVDHASAVNDGRAVKPMFLHDPLREPLTYQNVLASRPGATARCYGTLIAPELGEYGVFLERIDGLPLCFVGEFDAWTEAARWLAALHIHFHEHADTLTHVTPLLRYDRTFYLLWLKRALECHPSATGLGWLAERYSTVVERLETLPQTFIHGEFYASNILTQRTANELRVCPVDWEMAAIGPGLIDLAALATGHWTDAERRALLGAYYQRLDGTAESSAGFEDLLEALDFCRLHLAVQWLGWAPDWSPPPEHRQNWLAIAMELAEGLRL